MHMISHMSRPVELSFSRIVLSQKYNIEHNVHKRLSHLSKPTASSKEPSSKEPSIKEHSPVSPSITQFELISSEYDKNHSNEEVYHNGNTDFLSPTGKIKTPRSPRGVGFTGLLSPRGVGSTGPLSSLVVAKTRTSRQSSFSSNEELSDDYSLVVLKEDDDTFLNNNYESINSPVKNQKSKKMTKIKKTKVRKNSSSSVNSEDADSSDVQIVWSMGNAKIVNKNNIGSSNCNSNNVDSDNLSSNGHKNGEIKHIGIDNFSDTDNKNSTKIDIKSSSELSAAVEVTADNIYLRNKTDIGLVVGSIVIEEDNQPVIDVSTDYPCLSDDDDCDRKDIHIESTCHTHINEDQNNNDDNINTRHNGYNGINDVKNTENMTEINIKYQVSRNDFFSAISTGDVDPTPLESLPKSYRFEDSTYLEIAASVIDVKENGMADLDDDDVEEDDDDDADDEEDGDEDEEELLYREEGEEEGFLPRIRDEEEESDDSEENIIHIEPGTLVKVMRKKKWRSAIIKKQHRDGTYKVRIRVIPDTGVRM
jgi:hypothetical protein